MKSNLSAHFMLKCKMHPTGIVEITITNKDSGCVDVLLWDVVNSVVDTSNKKESDAEKKAGGNQ